MCSAPSRIRWAAIAAGFLTDFLLSGLIRGVTARYDPQTAQITTFTTSAGIVSAVLLVLSTGIGGWLAGRLARQEYTLHGTLVGGIGLIVMLIQSLVGSVPALVDIVLQCLAVAMGALGGWLSQWIPARQRP